MVSLPQLWEITILLAMMSITLIIALEMFSLRYSRIGLRLNRKRLRASAITVSLIFSLAMMIRVLEVLHFV